MDYLILTMATAAALSGAYLVYRQFRESSRASSNRLFVDTSALIDGRIIEVARSGFISDRLVIPRSVVGELQLLADKGDSEKRSKARQGLDMITQLQALESVEVEIFADNPRAQEGVDQRLIDLAKQHGGKICTIDFNLNKVAAVEGIAVSNINELAKNLRMSHLPGDKLELMLTDTGQGPQQAVGHLDDGTMVVVEQAAGQIGKKAEVEFIRSLQTDAGRMMFARLSGSSSGRATTNSKAPARKSKPSLPKETKATAKSRSASPRPAKARTSTAQPQKASSSAKARNTGRRSKPKTNEDRLVELANHQ